MTNIYGDFRRLVLAALDALVTEGVLPPGLDFGRVAVEPPPVNAHHSPGRQSGSARNS